MKPIEVEGNPLGLTEIMEDRLTLDEYKEHKIRMLRHDFKILLTYEEIEHCRGLKTRSEVDQFAHAMFMNRL